MKISAILLASAMIFTLVACGSSDTTESTASESASAAETEKPSESESAEPTETEDKENLAPDGVWETDSERVTIEDETVTIDYIDEDGEVTETYWVGSFELDEDSDTWTSTRDPEAEMTCESDTIEFTWSGEGDNVYDKLSYAITNEDGTQTTVVLDRVESISDVARGVGPAVEESGDGDTAAGTASPSASTSKNSDTASTNDNASDSAGTGNNSENDKSSGSTTSNSNNSGSTASNSSSGSTGSSNSSNNSDSNSGNNSSSSNSSSSSSSSSNSGSSSSSSGGSSSGTTATACSHNYQGTVTKAATCSAAGVKTYTCSKCGASYTESIPATGHSYNGGVVTKAATCSTAGATTYTCTKCGNSYTSSIPATGNHNWQAVYRTESVKVQDAVYETRVICNNCFNFSSRNKEEVYEHIWLVHNGIGGFTSGQVCIQDAVYENQQVLDHYVCSVCGATK